MTGKIGLIALGCPKNRADSETMLYLLGRAGYQTTPDPGEADALIVNTCGFLNSAKKEAIEAILDMAGYKGKRPGVRLIVAGCLAERYAEELLGQMPEIDALLGVTHYDQIVAAVEARERYVAVGDIDRRMPECGRALLTKPWTAYLKIAEGCDNRCSYCAIPSIRGQYRSRAFEDIIDEAEKLASQGVRELTLIAQDTTRYGQDIYGAPRLAELLKALCALEGLIWIRVLYLYPEMVGAQLLDCIENNPKICPYLDIPIQHIDSSVLRRMNRRSGEEDIRRMLASIRARKTPILLRTSLIAGFPGESAEAFARLKAFVSEGHFARLGVFAYSREEGTAAYGLKDQIPAKEKNRRRAALMRAQMAVSRAFNQSRVGAVERVLIEKRTGPNAYIGRSRFEAPEIDGVVRVRGAAPLEEGAFYPVRLTDAKDYDVEGEVIYESAE